MRFELEFSMKNEYLPFEYNRTFISFIKRSLEDYDDGKYYNDYYNVDLSKNHRKNFSWSVNLISPRFEKNGISVQGKKIIITFVDQDRLSSFILFNAFSNQVGKDFKVSNSNGIVLERITIPKYRKVTGNIVNFKMYSPLAIRIHNRESNEDRYLSVEDSDFIVEFKKSLEREFPKFKNEIEKLQLDFSGMKKQVVPLFGQKIDVSIGNFLISGDKELLKTMHENSVGSRKNAGFGVLSVEGSWELI